MCGDGRADALNPPGGDNLLLDLLAGYIIVETIKAPIYWWSWWNMKNESPPPSAAGVRLCAGYATTYC
jgi:hypothetical protein